MRLALPHALCRLARDCRGVAAVEMAIVTTAFLLPLTSGLAVTGQALLAQGRLDRAVHAGLLTTWSLGSSPDTVIIKAAMDSGYGTTSTAVVTSTATVSWYCMNKTTGLRGSNQGGSQTASCSNMNEVRVAWVTLNASATITPIFPVPGAPTWTLTSNISARAG